MDAVVVTHGLCALLYLALGVVLAVHSTWRPPVLALVGASLTTGAWALAVALDPASGERLRTLADVLRVVSGGAWVGFLALAYRSALPEGEPVRGLALPIAVAASAWLVLVGVAFSSGLRAELSGGALLADVSGRLVVAVAALYFVELLLRRSASEARWRIKHVCIGIGVKKRGQVSHCYM